MEQENFEELNTNNGAFDTPEVDSSENYETIGSLKVLKGLGILAGVGAAAVGAYTLFKKIKKKPIAVEYEEVNDYEEEETENVEVEDQLSEPEKESEN